VAPIVDVIPAKTLSFLSIVTSSGSLRAVVRQYLLLAT